jgi:hypothetical protein
MRCLLKWKKGMGDGIGDRGSLSAAAMAGVSSGFVLSSSDIAHANGLSNGKPASNSRELHPKWRMSFNRDDRSHQLVPVKISCT